MKKTLALLMSLALMLSCIAGLSISSSAAELEFVEETYNYEDILETEYGTHGDGDIEIDPDFGSFDSAEGFFFDGVWTYEYWDPEDKTFKPMTTYYKDAQSGWGLGGWNNLYTVSKNSAYSGHTYCMIMNGGKYIHPGDTAGTVITFVAPATGTITYDTSIYIYNENNSLAVQPETWGDYVTLWVNDTQVWPAEGDAADVNRISYDNTSEDKPLDISHSSFKVTAGDRIRLCVIAYGGTKASKGASLISGKMPTVTYHEAGDIPVGNPNGSAPTNVLTQKAEDKTVTDTIVTWDEVSKATGYNIYIKENEAEGEAQKVNDAPITETTYTVTGLKSNTFYELTVTAVMPSGNESAASDPYMFKTPKLDNDNSGNDSTADTNAPTTTDNGTNTPDPVDDSFPWWIIVVAAVAVVAIVVVVVLVLGKKKKPAEEKKDAE